LFDDRLPEVLPTFTDVDLAWIDGHHEKDPTLRYFDALKPSLKPGAVVLCDDIAWSPDMDEAWRILSTTEGFSDTVHLGSFGLGVWQGGAVRPRTWDMTAITGRPPVRTPQGRNGWQTHSA